MLSFKNSPTHFFTARPWGEYSSDDTSSLRLCYHVTPTCLMDFCYAAQRMSHSLFYQSWNIFGYLRFRFYCTTKNGSVAFYGVYTCRIWRPKKYIFWFTMWSVPSSHRTTTRRLCLRETTVTTNCWYITLSPYTYSWCWHHWNNIYFACNERKSLAVLYATKKDFWRSRATVLDSSARCDRDRWRQEHLLWVVFTDSGKLN